MDSPDGEADAQERSLTIEQSGPRRSGTTPSTPSGFLIPPQFQSRPAATRELSFTDAKPKAVGTRPTALTAGSFLPTASPVPHTDPIALWTPICSQLTHAISLALIISILPSCISALSLTAAAQSFTVFSVLDASYRRAQMCAQYGWAQYPAFKIINFSAKVSHSASDPLSPLPWGSADTVAQVIDSILAECCVWASVPNNVPTESEITAHISAAAAALMAALTNRNTAAVQTELGDLILLMVLLKAIDKTMPSTTDTGLSTPTRDAIWANSGTSRAFLARLGSTAMNPSTLVTVVCALLPVPQFAPSLSLWHKVNHHTLTAFVATFKKHHSELYTSIALIPTLSGAAARGALMENFEAMFGLFGTGLHEAFIIGVFVFILTTAPSTRKAFLNMILQYYLVLDNYNVALLEAAVEDPTSWRHLCATSPAPALTDTHMTAGYLRLSYSHNLEDFTENWRVLLDIMARALIAAYSGKSELSELRAKLNKHQFKCQTADESFPEFHARVMLEYETVKSRLRAINKSACLPTQEDMAQLLYFCSRSSLTERVKHLLTEGTPEREDEVSYDRLTQLYMQASAWEQVSYPDIDAALDAHKKSPKDHETPEPNTPGPPAPTPNQRKPQLQPPSWMQIC